jgi:hypothetical protein
VCLFVACYALISNGKRMLREEHQDNTSRTLTPERKGPREH